MIYKAFGNCFDSKAMPYLLLEVKLPCKPLCPSVGRYVKISKKAGSFTSILLAEHFLLSLIHYKLLDARVSLLPSSFLTPFILCLTQTLFFSLAPSQLQHNMSGRTDLLFCIKLFISNLISVHHPDISHHSRSGIYDQTRPNYINYDDDEH